MNNEIDIHADLKTLAQVLLERIDFLQSQNIQVQSQPLGFMRLALDGQKNNQDGYFLHVWIPGLPTQKDGPFKHTHVFNMTSRILLGSIRDTLYNPIVDENGGYQLITAECKENYCLPSERVQDKIHIEIERTLDLSAGDTYQVAKGSFHDTTVLGDGIAVTLIRKENVENKDPILVVPIGVAIPKDVFRRDQIDQEFAWNTIKELLNQINKKT